MANFSGKWKLESRENLEEFLKAIDVGLAKRTAIMKVNPTLDIDQNGDEFTIVTKTAMKTNEVKFKIGEKFSNKNPLLGGEVNLLTTWDGNKQVTVNADNPNGVKIIRELQGDKLVITQSIGDVTAKRIFARL